MNLKKIAFFLLALICSWGLANAQSPRLVLVEEFTQASCPPCASQNPAFNTLLNANTAKAVSLKYQVNWPGSDIMNLQNPAQVASRVSYYGVSGVPHAVVDGSVYSNSPSGVSQTTINNEYAVPSPFTIILTHWLNAATDSIFINCEITATQNTSMTTPRIRVALIEKTIDFTGQTPPGTNGEMVFENVMRKMYPHPQGIQLTTAWAAGDHRTLSFKEKIPAYIYDKAELAVVAWIQDDATKNVKQAGFSEFATTASTQAPITDFGVDVTAPCDGLVHFNDASALFPTSWLWNFGDGHTSTLQNPTHTYLNSGSYNVTLTATNANGSDQEVKNSYVQVTLAGTGPTGIDDNFCGTGVANLAAISTSGGTITWYDMSGAQLDTGLTYSPTLTTTTTFQISETVANPILSMGAPDTAIATGGVFFTSNNTHGLYFDVTLPCVLQTVEVYAGSTGYRTIDVIDSYGNVVYSLQRYINAGKSTVTLNFHFDVGQGYLIKVSSVLVDLFRNAGGATYPYVNNAITITGNTASTAPTNYYFFYNWQVQQDPCQSPLATVTAVDTCTVSAMEATMLTQNSVRVSPNPSHGAFNLAFEADRRDNYTISVTNTLGQVVYSQALQGFTGSFSEQLDLSGHSAGVYFLAITDSRNKIVKKLVKD